MHAFVEESRKEEIQGTDVELRVERNTFKHNFPGDVGDNGNDSSAMPGSFGTYYIRQLRSVAFRNSFSRICPAARRLKSEWLEGELPNGIFGLKSAGSVLRSNLKPVFSPSTFGTSRRKAPAPILLTLPEN